MARNREQNQGKGSNLGQGVANLSDQQRRDLAPSGDDAPTEDQRDKLTSGEQGHARAKHGGDDEDAHAQDGGGETRRDDRHGRATRH